MFELLRFLRLVGVIGDDMGILEKSDCPTGRQKSLWPCTQPLGSVMRSRVGMRSSLSLVGFLKGSDYAAEGHL